MSVDVNDEAIKQMGMDPDGPVGQLMLRYAVKVEGVAKVLCTLPGSGRVYLPGEYFLRRGGKTYHWTRTTMHQASAPGEPPAGDTGYLGASIGHQLVVRKTVVAQVQAKASYGLFVEAGTRYMKPRPFLRPALSSVMHSL